MYYTISQHGVEVREVRARRVRKNGIGGEVRRGVTSGASCETCLNKHVTPHLHRKYQTRAIISTYY